MAGRTRPGWRRGAAVTAAVLAAALALAACGDPAAPTAPGAVGPPPQAGDYYLLALSWSPEYCVAHPAPEDEAQCRAHAAVVVHGLWPQHASGGWPEFCGLGPDALPAPLVRAQLDLLPSERLVRHQWHKHGRCDGPDPAAYFARTREARTRIVLPALLDDASHARSTTPRSLRDALLSANPGLPTDALTLHCRGEHLREIRICLDPALAFRACGGGLHDRCPDRIQLRQAVSP